MDLTEKTLESQVVHQGHFLTLKRDTVSLPDGSSAGREYIVHPGAVAILAVDADGMLVLERQYRYPAGREFLEIPAGKIDLHEPHGQTARRELLEETGVEAAQWRLLGTAYPCIGYSDEKIHYYLATDLSQNERQLDEGEFLEVLRVHWREACEMALDGRICDSKSIVGLNWLAAHFAGRLPGESV